MELFDDIGFIDFEKMLVSKNWKYLSFGIPLIVIITLIISGLLGIPYKIDGELTIPAGEERIHNLESGKYYFLSEVCTEELLEYHNIDEERIEGQPTIWSECEQNSGFLNYSIFEYSSMPGERVNSSFLECKHNFLPQGFGDIGNYYCYGGQRVGTGQYLVVNDSPFEIKMIEHGKFHHQVLYMVSMTPIVTPFQGVLSCCCLFPIFTIMAINSSNRGKESESS